VRWSGSLAQRLVLIGLTQLALLSVVFMGVGWLVNGAPPEGPPGRGPPPGRDGAPPPPRGPHAQHDRLATPLNTLFFAGFVILGAGSLLTARSIVGPLRKLSRTASALGAGDLTVRSALDRSDEIGDVSRSFDAMAERVEHLVLAERELLANVSHELRTPLARIRVAMDIAGEGDGETQRQSMSEIGVDLAELEALIDDILTSARLELARGRFSAQLLELHDEEVAADVLCHRTESRFRARHPSRSLVVSAAAEAGAVRVDPVLFRRVLDNLLENAHKYSRDERSTITLRASADGDDVVFEVEDRGIGIAEADMPRVFLPFFRSDRSRARGTGGVGLGLTLAKRIVEAHAGTITVSSEIDVGTTVRVRLPRA